MTEFTIVIEDAGTKLLRVRPRRPRMHRHGRDR